LNIPEAPNVISATLTNYVKRDWPDYLLRRDDKRAVSINADCKFALHRAYPAANADAVRVEFRDEGMRFNPIHQVVIIPAVAVTDFEAAGGYIHFGYRVKFSKIDLVEFRVNITRNLG